jgi:CheY-like chemotaxis protein
MKKSLGIQEEEVGPDEISLGSGSPPALGPADLAEEIEGPLSLIVNRLDDVVERLRSGGPDLRACIRDVQRPLEDARQAAQRIRAIVRHMVVNLEPLQGESPADGLLPGATIDSAQPRARILVVDDEIILGNALRRSLREYDVVALANAKDALARISAGERFDFILCDIMMPELTGVDFYERVLRLEPDQADRIVFMTGGAITPRTEQFLSTTVNPVIEKPFGPQRVRDLIRERLEGIELVRGPHD